MTARLPRGAAAFGALLRATGRAVSDEDIVVACSLCEQHAAIGIQIDQTGAPRHVCGDCAAPGQPVNPSPALSATPQE